MITSINLQIVEGNSISNNELKKFVSILDSKEISPEDKIADFIRSFIKEESKKGESYE